MKAKAALLWALWLGPPPPQTSSQTLFLLVLPSHPCFSLRFLNNVHKSLLFFFFFQLNRETTLDILVYRKKRRSKEAANDRNTTFTFPTLVTCAPEWDCRPRRRTPWIRGQSTGSPETDFISCLGVEEVCLQTSLPNPIQQFGPKRSLRTVLISDPVPGVCLPVSPGNGRGRVAVV